MQSSPAVRARHALLLVVLAVICVPANPAAADETASGIEALIAARSHPYLQREILHRYRDDMRRTYEPRGFAPLWSGDGRPTAAAAAIIEHVRAATACGLNPADYDAERLATARLELANVTSAADAAAFDVAVTGAAMRYAADTYRGRVDQREAGFELDVEPKTIDLSALMYELAQVEEPRQRLTDLEPAFPAYARLKQALARMQALDAARIPPLPALPKLRPGDTDAGVPALRQLLSSLGDLPPDAPFPAEPQRYDEALVAAVEHFQRRHGLTADGIIGSDTQRQLAVPIGDRVGQIRLAMERLRWLPYRFPARFILVNIPEFRLRGFEREALVAALSMNVVVGSATQRAKTPVLHGDMRYLVFRPYWHVPRGITREEMLPKIHANPGYLARQALDIVAQGQIQPPTPENIAAVAAGEARLRQRSGPKNSLGLLKFIFPNPRNVYLHDTPSKGLFQRSRRDFSHGCIRVADPVALAEFVLAGQVGWDRERITTMMNDTRPRHINVRVNLDQPVPVYLFYSTVAFDEAGEAYFLDDIYGHDAKLRQLLSKGSR